MTGAQRGTHVLLHPTPTPTLKGPLTRCRTHPPSPSWRGWGGGRRPHETQLHLRYLARAPRAMRAPVRGADVGGGGLAQGVGGGWGGPLSCGWGHDGPSDDLRFGRYPPCHRPRGPLLCMCPGGCASGALSVPPPPPPKPLCEAVASSKRTPHPMIQPTFFRREGVMTIGPSCTCN